VPIVTATFSSFVPPNHQGLTLVAYLAQRFPYCDEAEWRRRVEVGLVMVDGAPGQADAELFPKQKVTSTLPDHREPELPEEVELIHRGAEIGIFGKSAGVPVTRTGEVVYNTFVQQARRATGNPEVRLLHRLDRETSGLILCAMDPIGLRHQKAMEVVLRRKFYLAVVEGVPVWETLECDAPLRETESHAVRARMEVHAEGKPSRTSFVRIASGPARGAAPSAMRGSAPSPARALVLAEIHSGRKHQIRAHLAHLGNPVIGDKIYAHDGRFYLKMVEGGLTAEDYAELGAENHLLHSWGAEIALPLEPEDDDDDLGLDLGVPADRYAYRKGGGAGRLEQYQEPRMFYSALFSAEYRAALEAFPGWEAAARGAVERLLAQPDAVRGPVPELD